MRSTQVELVINLNDWFIELVDRLNCRHDTRAYISSVLTQYKSSEDDLSKISIVLAYAEAKKQSNFVNYKKIGDWVLWVSSTHPHFFDNRELVQTIGQLSYNACNKLLRGSWPLYEELADNLPVITRHVNKEFLRLSK